MTSFDITIKNVQASQPNSTVAPFSPLPSVNPAMMYLANLTSSESRRTMRSKLNRISKMVGFNSLEECVWEKMRYVDVNAIILRLENEGLSSTSINNYLAALKGVALQAWKEELMPQDTYMRIKTIKSRRTHRLPTGRCLSMSETFRLLNVSQRGLSPEIEARDMAILSLMIGCGLRRAEITNLLYENYSQSDMSIRLIGKGNKERIVFLPPEVDKNLNIWIHKYRGTFEGWLFNRIYKGGNIEKNKKLGITAISLILKERLSNVGIENATPHDLRRTFATRLIEDGNDLVKVQRAMGHANVQTTARYDRRSDKEQKEMAKNVRI